VSSAETVDFGVAGRFASNLSALKYFDRVAAISEAAGDEYAGWRMMLSGSGLAGPDVAAVDLPVEAVEPEPVAVAQVRELFQVDDQLPILLCVGSHEPRKNHLALLQAAELAWKSGTKFALIFVGGNSWRSSGFVQRVDELRVLGRPVLTLTAIPDELLWAAYRVAHAVAFPSLNEGFGLPVAESLALGTPVLTSDFGSMAAIAHGGGAILVDPRDDDSIADGIRRMIDDHSKYERLLIEAADRQPRTWDQYAAETWSVLVGPDI
jgi:glycosyltransferase involved in cell wall biosynthesis